MKHVLVNDGLLTRDRVTVDMEDRGYQFGDGIYEVFGIYDGKPFLLDEHLQRLERSAAELSMKLPCDQQSLKTKLTELYRTDGIRNGLVYMQITRGVAPRDHAFPDAGVPCELTAYTIPRDRPFQTQASGVAAILAEDIRWLRCDIKSLNLLGNVMAKQQAKDRGAFEAILHRNSTVTEGSSTNAFVVKDGTVITHPTGNLILNGITRTKVLELCRSHNVPVREERYSTEFLLSADEVFITGTFIDIVPVVTVDGRNISGGRPGDVTSRLQKLMNHLIEEL